MIIMLAGTLAGCDRHDGEQIILTSPFDISEAQREIAEDAKANASDRGGKAALERAGAKKDMDSDRPEGAAGPDPEDSSADKEEARQSVSRTTALEEVQCEPMAQEPLIDLNFSTFYKRDDKSLSTIDKDAQSIYREQTKNLRIFERALAGRVNAYSLSGGRDVAAGLCSLKWLREWALAGGLLGESNSQGDFIRQWMLATLASAYVQVRDLTETKPSVRLDIDSWVKDLGRRVVARYPTDFHESGPHSFRNNHMYWAAWATVIAGVATNEQNLYQWGVEKTRFALVVQASDEGVFPLELKRGKRAFLYHNFAMTPLVMVAETALRNGEDLYELRGGMLHKIAGHVIEGMSDPAYFEELSGEKQVNADDISSEHFAWLEVYHMRFPSEEAKIILEKRRPVFSRRAGGDVTALFNPRRAVRGGM